MTKGELSGISTLWSDVDSQARNKIGRPRQFKGYPPAKKTAQGILPARVQSLAQQPRRLDSRCDSRSARTTPKRSGAFHFERRAHIWKMEITHYFVVRLAQTADGGLVAGECEEKLTAMAAVTSARVYATKKGGAIAFSQRGDPALGGSEPRHILAGFGTLPPKPSFPRRLRFLNRSNRLSSPPARRRLGPRPLSAALGIAAFSFPRTKPARRIRRLGSP
jgi:hypothetical protein